MISTRGAIEARMSMGDAVNCHACGAFVRAYGGLVVERFRSRLLDETFGPRVRYYLYCGYFDSWQVVLRAVVDVGGGKKEEFDIPESAFFPPADDIVDDVSRRLGLSVEDAERRWERAVEEFEREDEDEDEDEDDS
jgi:hypothetical protein